MSQPISRPRGLKRLFSRRPSEPPAAPVPVGLPRREPGFAPVPAQPPQAYPDDAMLAGDLADGAWPDPILASQGGDPAAYPDRDGDPAAYVDRDGDPAAYVDRDGDPAAYADEQASDDDYARDPAWDMAPGTRRDLSPEGMLGVFSLGKAYKGRKVVHDVSINVRRGEAVGLLGPNGAGKTTVFYMITGLVKPDKGMHRTRWPRCNRRCRCTDARGSASATCPRKRRSSAASMSRTIFAPSSKSRCRTRNSASAELDELLDEFNITRLRKTPSIALSGGERRRCEIAQRARGPSRPSCCSTNPSRASTRSRWATSRISCGISKQRGIGVLITDHNVRETLGLIDRAYIIHSGHVLDGRARPTRSWPIRTSGASISAKTFVCDVMTCALTIMTPRPRCNFGAECPCRQEPSVKQEPC